ncbi:hypothetical protein LSAT2_017539, partial [Lamellibrachia satsuma]
RKEQAATKLKPAQHDAAIPPPQKKRKYRVVNQRLAQFKQELAGDRHTVTFRNVNDNARDTARIDVSDKAT